MEGARFDLLPVHLCLNEALALYFAARLLCAQSDKHNPHAVSALQKLTHAWAERRQVRLLYRNPRTGEVTERVLDPYFIDPSAVGYTCYVIGHDHLRGAIRQFKLERIDKVEFLDTGYSIRNGFDPYAYLAHAWGVMGGDRVIEVVLRFSPRVTYRIRESDWPAVVSVVDNADGGCTMTLQVNHTLEMKPWIRGWGPDCEVLKPEDLRQEIAEEMKAAGEVYEEK